VCVGEGLTAQNRTKIYTLMKPNYLKIQKNEGLRVCIRQPMRVVVSFAIAELFDVDKGGEGSFGRGSGGRGGRGPTSMDPRVWADGWGEPLCGHNGGRAS